MRIEDISDEVWSVPGALNIIDAILRTTGLTVYGQHTEAQVLARYPDAVRLTWAAWQQAAIERQRTPITWAPTSAERFDEMLCVLPPAMMAGGAFLVGEPDDHDVATGSPRFAAYRQRGDVYEVASRPMTRAELRAELAPRFASAADTREGATS